LSFDIQDILCVTSCIPACPHYCLKEAQTPYPTNPQSLSSPPTSSLQPNICPSHPTSASPGSCSPLLSPYNRCLIINIYLQCDYCLTKMLGTRSIFYFTFQIWQYLHRHF
jgi:hypothetical protein